MRMRPNSPTRKPGLVKKSFPPLRDSPAMIPLNEPAKWEVRPCGMLVQKRSSDENPAASPAPTIHLRVKHGSIFHEIYISSQATFGELKKLLAERIGLHPLDQKITFKDKERCSAAFLDISGVKDGSKMVVVEDPAAQAKRLLEIRRAVKMEKSSKSISQITLEVDKLASQVSALERVILKGGNVAENDVLRLIELLMNELLKLDGVVVAGDAGDFKLKRRAQVRRVQSYVETLDMMKIKSTMPKSNSRQSPATEAAPPHHQSKKQTPAPSPQHPPVIVTTKWETFHTLFSPRATESTSVTTTASSAGPTPRLDWELF
ncbi:BAG family molecular chaperone regulator 1 [Platanthera zijinensis]|uniref:BAG family molecular chaperone regulator 1 n=1 Tax=Platanthera zijinensis TaxID=2320716 RepID=A0AAP0G8H2_9ASPA